MHYCIKILLLSITTKNEQKDV
ncbi:hypothetical protein BDFB_014975 [Asbolus verrucosus]|uniref:Uncharacterized protein n=1 Tax=Asbolus verrucosus TaxID=1661398 RepID=A0A482V933_ASBVE|nr:hypothetical protein BDFB_014975 [Asbolus verrucosus]